LNDENSKVIKLSNQRIVLYLNEPQNSKEWVANNIKSYDSDGNLNWEIGILLEEYASSNKLEYCEDVYFDILVIAENRLKCIGFNNHCEIDLIKSKIVRLMNNR